MPEDKLPDIRWLSYQEIAVVRGISRTSAERMVRRAKWRRQVDNQGVTKAAVPLSYLERDPADPPDRPPDRQGENLPGNGLLHDAVRAFEASISTLTEQLARERDRSDKSTAAMIEAEKAAGELRRKLDVAQTALAKAEAGAAELRDQLDQTRAEAEAALQAAVDLKAAARGSGEGRALDAAQASLAGRVSGVSGTRSEPGALLSNRHRSPFAVSEIAAPG